MEIIAKYLLEEAFVMIPVLWIIAEAIKRGKRIEDHYIPYILIFISLAFTPWLLGGYTPQNFVQAILVCGGEMVGYQLYDKGKEIFTELVSRNVGK